jgi:hypothetical protein
MEVHFPTFKNQVDQQLEQDKAGNFHEFNKQFGQEFGIYFPNLPDPVSSTSNVGMKVDQQLEQNYKAENFPEVGSQVDQEVGKHFPNLLNTPEPIPSTSKVATGTNGNADFMQEFNKDLEKFQKQHIQPLLPPKKRKYGK